VTAYLWYAFGALLLHLEVAGQLGLDRVTALPRIFVVTLAGLAILFTMHDSLQRSYSGSCRFGALVPFAVAATPFKILGIPSSFWAILLGIIASLMAERAELFAQWHQKQAHE
jgi:benzoate membrane transport protein